MSLGQRRSRGLGDVASAWFTQKFAEPGRLLHYTESVSSLIMAFHLLLGVSFTFIFVGGELS